MNVPQPCWDRKRGRSDDCGGWRWGDSEDIFIFATTLRHSTAGVMEPDCIQLHLLCSCRLYVKSSWGSDTKRAWFHLMCYLKPIRSYLVFTPNQTFEVYPLHCSAWRRCCDGDVSVHGAETFSHCYFSHTEGAHCKNTAMPATHTKCKQTNQTGRT